MVQGLRGAGDPGLWMNCSLHRCSRHLLPCIPAHTRPPATTTQEFTDFLAKPVYAEKPRAEAY